MKRKATPPVVVRKGREFQRALTTKQAAKIRQTFASATAENTTRAYRSDLEHYWQWANAAPSYPIPAPRLMAYLADASESLSVSTLTRRVAAISTAHRLQGIAPEANPSLHPQVRQYLSALRRQASKAGRRPRKRKAATLDVLRAMLATCAGGTLQDHRDAAILALGFASGGRRRSELVALDVRDVEAVPGGFLVHVRRSKTDQRGDGLIVPCRGHCADHLRAWLAAAGNKSGSLFRSINRHGQLGKGLSGHSVGLIVKHRAKLAGYDPSQFGGHSLRSGFVTEAGRQGIAAGDAMALSGHKSLSVFSGYYQSGAVMKNPAGGLMDSF